MKELIEDRQTDNSISFLKTLLSFYVVLCHYLIHDDSRMGLLLYRQKCVAVPIFILISFYLTYRMYESIDLDNMRKRIRRLVYPYLIWASIYYITYSIINVSTGKESLFSLKDLIWQIALGSDRNLCPQMWYLFDIIIFTIVYFIVCMLFPKNKKKMLCCLMVFCLLFQYSGLNARIFASYEYEMRYPLGRLAECFPF